MVKNRKTNQNGTESSFPGPARSDWPKLAMGRTRPYQKRLTRPERQMLNFEMILRMKPSKYNVTSSRSLMQKSRYQWTYHFWLQPGRKLCNVERRWLVHVSKHIISLHHSTFVYMPVVCTCTFTKHYQNLFMPKLYAILSLEKYMCTLCSEKAPQLRSIIYQRWGRQHWPSGKQNVG